MGSVGLSGWGMPSKEGRKGQQRRADHTDMDLNCAPVSNRNVVPCALISLHAPGKCISLHVISCVFVNLISEESRSMLTIVTLF